MTMFDLIIDHIDYVNVYVVYKLMIYDLIEMCGSTLWNAAFTA